ncbi:Nif3-like dinuclear metal center hexameric protein [Blastococcus brunescens]|uniref:GTP cyclohydrolase 1 type 2 homolog n=1 Tax=Blastococcus brunescens TaxID=1564165 RepID=A0ABZ1B6P6_9ACTN|nr:Nif3-like dinuclear metal center hexameric protein [Blastococcus sp. BMG 8361]WRL65796.1 Nif3-like dinuclear metal center hexameric protein [Blastococcus sp. BMG 8361]
MAVPLREVIAALDARYDPALAESWDAVGLVCGDPDEPVGRVLFAVDPTTAVVDEVIGTGTDLLVTHHPLLLTPVHGVPADDPKGRVVHRLVRARAALFVAHTNADRAPGSGVNAALADLLGLTGAVPLEPAGDDPRAGLGRVGDLPEPTTLRAFASFVAQVLPETVGGVRAAGDPDRVVRRVAVCGGSGGSLLGAAAAAGADVLLTSDLKHHPVSDAGEVPGPALCDVAHYASEWPWLPVAAEVLRSDLAGQVEVAVSRLRTDPWTWHAGADPATRGRLLAALPRTPLERALTADPGEETRYRLQIAARGRLHVGETTVGVPAGRGVHRPALHVGDRQFLADEHGRPRGVRKGPLQPDLRGGPVRDVDRRHAQPVVVHGEDDVARTVPPADGSDVVDVEHQDQPRQVPPVLPAEHVRIRERPGRRVLAQLLVEQ